MNAKEEFLIVTKDKEIKCAIINGHVLNEGYKPFDLIRFLGMIDFDYDQGYGSQELFGIIWCVDGTWFER